MLLTGLGSEQNFKTGGTSYFLVFNNGELRVPISEEAAEVVVKEMYGGQDTNSEEPSQETSTDNLHSYNADAEYGDSDDDGVPQL